MREIHKIIDLKKKRKEMYIYYIEIGRLQNIYKIPIGHRMFFMGKAQQNFFFFFKKNRYPRNG